MKDGRQQVQHYLAGHSFGAQHANALHFGLGDSDVAELQVTWPDGTTTKLATPAAGAYHRVAQTKE